VTHDPETHDPHDPRARPNKRMQQIREHINTKLQTQINSAMTDWDHKVTTC